MKSLLKISVLISAVVIAIGLTLHLDQKLFAIEAVDIEWTPQAKDYCQEQKLLCESLQNELTEKLKSVTHKKIWQVDIASLREGIMQNNWLKMVAVSRLYPNKIGLSLDIEVPIALLSNNSEILAVGDDGQLLSPVKTSFLPALPILKGENFSRSIVIRKLATDFLKAVEDNSELSPKSIAEMTYSKDENFSLLILPSKSIVKMGLDHVTLKAARVAQVIEYLNSNQMNGRVIDARFSKKVLVRLRKGS